MCLTIFGHDVLALFIYGPWFKRDVKFEWARKVGLKNKGKMIRFSLTGDVNMKS